MNIQSQLVPALRSAPRPVVSTAAVVLAFSFIALLGTSCASTQDSTLILGGDVRDASSGPTFVATPDGGEDASPAKPVELCIATECPYPYATCALVANG